MPDRPRAGDTADRYVVPYYLQMMATNAADADEALLDEVRLRAGELSPPQVRQLLLDSWRPRVMGAWYAIALRRPELADAVLVSLRTSYGHLTSPPLLVAALEVGGEDSRQAIIDYEHADVAHGWGAAGLARAAADRLAVRQESQSPLPPPTQGDREGFDALRRVAERLGDHAPPD